MKKSFSSTNIQELLTEFSDLIFPPSAEERLLRSIKSEKRHLLFRPGEIRNTHYLCLYSEPVIRAAILENKFHHNPLAARLLRDILRLWVIKQNKPTLYIPIPLGRERLRQRGHNQVETILEKIVQKQNIANKVLRRKIETLPQSQLDKNLRHKNVHNAFEFIGQTKIFANYDRVVLVDDVLTTGATLDAARASLAPHLPENINLISLAIAH